LSIDVLIYLSWRETMIKAIAKTAFALAVTVWVSAALAAGHPKPGMGDGMGHEGMHPPMGEEKHAESMTPPKDDAIHHGGMHPPMEEGMHPVSGKPPMDGEELPPMDEGMMEP
jgi:hypothetical protein